MREALRRVRELADAQRPSLNLPERQLDPATLQRFSPSLPDQLDDAEAERLRERADELSPWLQGPFYLGGDVVIEGMWRNDQRWDAIVDLVPDVRGKRVLDVGSNAGYDPFMFRARGAAEVLACEPFEFIAQAQFLESIYHSGVRLEQMGWQQLDPEVHGTFDLVHCNGVLYHEPDPLGMLTRLRTMVAEGGELLLGSMMLADAEVSDHARFVRGAYAGDPTWWWVPGRLALRWMMDACGFETEALPIWFGGPQGDFEVINGYFRGRLAEPDPQLAVAKSIQPRDRNARARVPVEAGPSQPSGRSETTNQASGTEPINRFPVGHYYSPMYDSRELAQQREQLWPPSPREAVGIDWREEAQLELCHLVFAQQQQLEFIDEPSGDQLEYHTSNDQYPPLDAWVLAGMLEHLNPRRMIEVGSGFSTLVSARTNRERLASQMQLTCVEPYPRDFVLQGIPGVSDLRVERIQDTPLALFSELSAGDVLFIDTAHTVKTGGDVVWIFQEIIPRLAPGVYVHIHDVFVPGEYPQAWVMDGWGWNETYLVRAFLSFNAAFEIVWGQQYMLHHHLQELRSAFPGLERSTPSGAALWIRRA
ncbi:MAG: class I SAM-dependent methyltransferase [Solirubrobacteraceae bacterium]